MVTLARARQVLGPDAPADDDKLEKVVEQADRLARLLAEMYRDSRKTPADPARQAAP